jgi:hypothetical protein
MQGKSKGSKLLKNTADFLQRAEDAAMERIKARRQAAISGEDTKQRAGLDTDMIEDYAIIGASRIAKGFIAGAEWATEMTRLLGDIAKGDLDKVRQRADEIYSRTLEDNGIKGKAKESAQKKLSAAAAKPRMEAIADRVKAKVNDGAELSQYQRLVQSYALALVRAGVTGRDAVVGRVHDMLTAQGLDVSKEETMDLISGYGDFKALDKEKAKQRLREIKGELQQLGKLADMKEGRAPKKTGMERREPSMEERKLIKVVNEEKKKGGFDVTDPEKQLKSALDAIETRLKNEIEELEDAIATRTPLLVRKNTPKENAEIRRLKKIRDKKKAEYNELFKDTEKELDRQRAQIEKDLDRRIARLQKDLKEGKLYPDAPKEKPTSAAIETKRAELDALRAERDMLRNADTDRVEAMVLKRKKAALARSSANLAKKIAEGDFAPKPKREVELDEEGKRLLEENQKIRKKYYSKLFEYKRANEKGMQKAARVAHKLVTTSRAVMTSLDLSAVGRQGILLAAAHPVIAFRSLKPMFMDAVSEVNAKVGYDQLMQRENAGLYTQGKLFLVDPDEINPNKREEAYMSEWAENLGVPFTERIADKVAGEGTRTNKAIRIVGRLPGGVVKVSGRAYVGYLNALRANVMDYMVNNTKARFGDISDIQAKALANYINIATGRGNFGSGAGAAPSADMVFFAPRLVWSRFEYILGQPLWGKHSRTAKEVGEGIRRQIALEYLKTAAGAVAMLTLGVAAGADLEDDPTSSDFGKLRFGNTRYDFLGGLIQATVLLMRGVTGKKKTVSGKQTNIRGETDYGADDYYDVFARFIRSKFNPAVGSTFNLASGKNVIGEKVTPASEAVGMMTPMVLNDVYDAAKNDGWSEAAIAGFFAFMGVGVQNFKKRQKKVKFTKF